TAAMRERELDALLVSERLNVRYMTGFTGTAGMAIFLSAGEEATGAPAHRFLTDFRYATQSAKQIPEHMQREIVTGSLFEAAGAPHARPRRRALLSHDRRSRRARRAPARRSGEGGDRARRSAHDRLGRTRGGLLLGLHAHVRHRRGRIGAGA